MRLSSTLARGLVELPPPPGPIGMYVCGPTVYARAHIGNARPYVIGSWYARWLRAARLRGHARPQHHGRERQDLRGGARGERRARPPGDRVVPRGRRPLRARRGRPLPEGDRDDSRDRPLHLRPDRARLRVRGRGRCLLPRCPAGRVRTALRAAARSGRGAGAERAQGGSARLRALEGEQAGRGHVVGVAVGARSPGLAHRVLGDGREAPRAVLRDPRRRARPRLPPPRERARPVERARPRVRPDLDAQRDAPLHRREDVEVGRQRRDDPGGARALGARDDAALLPDRALAQPDRLLRRADGGGAGTRRRLPRCVQRQSFSACAGRAAWERLVAILDDDFSTPEALARAARVAGAGLLDTRRGLEVFGLWSLAEFSSRRARGMDELARRRQEARAARDFAESDRLRAEIEAAGWEIRDEADAYRLVPKA